MGSQEGGRLVRGRSAASASPQIRIVFRLCLFCCISLVRSPPSTPAESLRAPQPSHAGSSAGPFLSFASLGAGDAVADASLPMQTLSPQAALLGSVDRQARAESSRRAGVPNRRGRVWSALSGASDWSALSIHRRRDASSAFPFSPSGLDLFAWLPRDVDGGGGRWSRETEPEFPLDFSRRRQQFVRSAAQHDTQGWCGWRRRLRPNADGRQRSPGRVPAACAAFLLSSLPVFSKTGHARQPSRASSPLLRRHGRTLPLAIDAWKRGPFTSPAEPLREIRVLSTHSRLASSAFAPGCTPAEAQIDGQASPAPSSKPWGFSVRRLGTRRRQEGEARSLRGDVHRLRPLPLDASSCSSSEETPEPHARSASGLPRSFPHRTWERHLYTWWEKTLDIFDADTAAAHVVADATLPARPRLAALCENDPRDPLSCSKEEDTRDAVPTRFRLLMPPPNLTGPLHLGHAASLALQDLLVRFRRMLLIRADAESSQNEERARGDLGGGRESGDGERAAKGVDDAERSPEAETDLPGGEFASRAGDAEVASLSRLARPTCPSASRPLSEEGDGRRPDALLSACPTEWIPGTDHAGLAMAWLLRRHERRVAQRKKKTGNAAPRGLAARESPVAEQSGRGARALLERWAAVCRHVIRCQQRRLGCSCDWRRSVYTLDPAYSQLVARVFVQLWRRSLIRKGKYLTLWDTEARTALADFEVLFPSLDALREAEKNALKHARGDGALPASPRFHEALRPQAEADTSVAQANGGTEVGRAPRGSQTSCEKGLQRTASHLSADADSGTERRDLEERDEWLRAHEDGGASGVLGKDVGVQKTTESGKSSRLYFLACKLVPGLPTKDPETGDRPRTEDSERERADDPGMREEGQEAKAPENDLRVAICLEDPRQLRDVAAVCVKPHAFQRLCAQAEKDYAAGLPSSLARVTSRARPGSLPLATGRPLPWQVVLPGVGRSVPLLIHDGEYLHPLAAAAATRLRELQAPRPSSASSSRSSAPAASSSSCIGETTGAVASWPRPGDPAGVSRAPLEDRLGTDGCAETLAPSRERELALRVACVGVTAFSEGPHAGEMSAPTPPSGPQATASAPSFALGAAPASLSAAAGAPSPERLCRASTSGSSAPTRGGASSALSASASSSDLWRQIDRERGSLGYWEDADESGDAPPGVAPRSFLRNWPKWTSTRTGAEVQLRLSSQWLLDLPAAAREAANLAGTSQGEGPEEDAEEEGGRAENAEAAPARSARRRLQLLPERVERQWSKFVGAQASLRPWCLSRQLDWGVPLPVWRVRLFGVSRAAKKAAQTVEKTGTDTGVSAKAAREDATPASARDARGAAQADARLLAEAERRKESGEGPRGTEETGGRAGRRDRAREAPHSGETEGGGEAGVGADAREEDELGGGVEYAWDEVAASEEDAWKAIEAKIVRHLLRAGIENPKERAATILQGARLRASSGGQESHGARELPAEQGDGEDENGRGETTRTRGEEEDIYAEIAQTKDVLDTWFSSALWPLACAEAACRDRKSNEDASEERTSGTPAAVAPFSPSPASTALSSPPSSSPSPLSSPSASLSVCDSARLPPLSSREGRGCAPSAAPRAPHTELVTGEDILFFWVLRQFVLCGALTRRTPFSRVTLHGLLVDGEGKKLSKTKGNVARGYLNRVIEEAGADALRWTLLSGISPGSSIAFDQEALAVSRRFLHKLWNVGRFVERFAATFPPFSASARASSPSCGESEARGETAGACHRPAEDARGQASQEESAERRSCQSPLVARYFWSRSLAVAREVSALLERMETGAAAQILQSFLWREVADWLIPAAAAARVYSGRPEETRPARTDGGERDAGGGRAAPEKDPRADAGDGEARPEAWETIVAATGEQGARATALEPKEGGPTQEQRMNAETRLALVEDLGLWSELLLSVFDVSLRLLHPFVPFVTEALFQTVVLPHAPRHHERLRASDCSTFSRETPSTFSPAPSASAAPHPGTSAHSSTPSPSSTVSSEARGAVGPSASMPVSGLDSSPPLNLPRALAASRWALHSSERPRLDTEALRLFPVLQTVVRRIRRAVKEFQPQEPPEAEPAGRPEDEDPSRTTESFSRMPEVDRDGQRVVPRGELRVELASEDDALSALIEVRRETACVRGVVLVVPSSVSFAEEGYALAGGEGECGLTNLLFSGCFSERKARRGTLRSSGAHLWFPFRLGTACVWLPRTSRAAFSPLRAARRERFFVATWAALAPSALSVVRRSRSPGCKPRAARETPLEEGRRASEDASELDASVRKMEIRVSRSLPSPLCASRRSACSPPEDVQPCAASQPARQCGGEREDNGDDKQKADAAERRREKSAAQRHRKGEKLKEQIAELEARLAVPEFAVRAPADVQRKLRVRLERAKHELAKAERL
ncbi:putative tRNA synthetase [Besnoitia besnoiti]|uniref:valine--tRNA ligase n=1 Tax=Besnoitia besnoiti TaxID=94643 RepID=A0A2A9MF36_BESBE|nr:putative tRNA synthetase [Besnoitia besnoiti]PFH34871.1 putative tRNA synthetase [Besnoitia besnoiti]